MNEYRDQLILAVPDDYALKETLAESNDFFNTIILKKTLLPKFKSIDTVTIAVIPTWSINPLIVKSSDGGLVIVYDHILMVASQIYCRALIICARLAIKKESAKMNVYILKIYSVIISLFTDKSNMARNLSEVGRIEGSMGIKETFTSDDELLLTGCCMTLEYFTVAHELLHIGEAGFDRTKFQPVKLQGKEAQVCQYSPEALRAVDSACVAWLAANQNKGGMSVGLDEELSMSNALNFFTLLALLEKNGAFDDALPKFESSINRLNALKENSQKKFSQEIIDGIDQKLELSGSLPDTRYLDFMNAAYSAFFRTERTVPMASPPKPCYHDIIGE